MKQTKIRPEEVLDYERSNRLTGQQAFLILFIVITVIIVICLFA